MNNDNICIKKESFCEVYKEALNLLLNNNSYETSPRGFKIKENLNIQFVIQNPSSNLFINSYRGIPLSYLKNELLLYFSGRNDAKGFIAASKFWENIKNGEFINSAYGKLIFNTYDTSLHINSINTQWEWAKNSLMNDSDTRQAILHFNRPSHQYINNKDFVCTMYGIFHIRNNKLNFSIFMRSQDIRKGTQFDIPFFTLLQQVMLFELRQIEKFKDLTLGEYSHFCNSLHIYQFDFNIAELMLNANWQESKTPEFKNNPIMHSDIIKLSHDKNYNLSDSTKDDEFFNWLKS